jgi:hypothetical protein
MDNLNLDNLKVGDLVVSIRPTRKQGAEYGGIRVVTEWDEKWNRWRYANPTNPSKNVGAFPPDGGCKDFMSKNLNPDYYFSANPEHLKAAENQHHQAALLRQKKEEQEKARFDEFSEKLHALLAEYGAGVCATQISGDDQGVEVMAEIFIGNHSIKFNGY